ncbi:MAG: hypothetical protein QW782_06220, partial [Candidatus Bathyarchaeia archaeon]
MKRPSSGRILNKSYRALKPSTSTYTSRSSLKHTILKLTIALLLFNFTFIPRLLVAPYTSHGYNVKVFETWVQRILADGFNFYIPPTQDMLEPDPEWGHDPSFCEYPPIYIYFLWIAGKIYEYISPKSNPYLLVLLIKLPMIASESIITVLIFYLVSRRRNTINGILAAGMYAAEPFCFFTEGIGAYAEGMTPLFGILSLYMVTRRRYYEAALFFGLAMMVKPTAFVYLFPIIIFMYEDIKLRFVKALAFAILPMIIVSLPFLFTEPFNYISAMLWGGFHNLGRRMPTGVIWVNPSFWFFIKCISGDDIYRIIAPSQIFLYIIITVWLWLQIVKRGLSREKSNIWFVGFIFVFSMMMFLPAAHEKWIYPAYPLLAMSAFLSQDNNIKRFSLLAFLVLTVTYFQFIFAPIWSVHYHFESTEVLPPIEERLQAMSAISRWLYQWLYSLCRVLSMFAGQPFDFLYAFINVILFIKLCLVIRKVRFSHTQKQLMDSKSLNLTPSTRVLKKDEKGSLTRSLSVKEVKCYVNDQLETFKVSLKSIKDIFLKIEELAKIFQSGGVEKNTYEILMSELSNSLPSPIEKMFIAMRELEMLRAKAKIEQIKEIVDEIDNVLSSLTLEEELLIIERYLSIMREVNSLAKLKEAEQICQQRLNTLLGKWSSIRGDKIRKITDLEMEALRLKDKIREIEVRFAVGEFNRNIYESMLNELQGSLRRIEKEVSEIRN